MEDKSRQRDRSHVSFDTPGSHAGDEAEARTGTRSRSPLKFRGINIVSVLVSVAAILALILHVVEPTWKIDSIAIALLVVAALPWLGESLESIDLPGGGGVRYRTRLENVEVKAAHVEGQVAELREIFPLLLPGNLLVHLKNLAAHKTKPYWGNEPFKDQLRALRGMQLIELLPQRTSEGKGIGSIPNGEFDLADWVRLTGDGHKWLARADEIEKQQARLPQ